MSPRVKAAKKVGGEQRRVAGGKQAMLILIFELFTELPLIEICKKDPFQAVLGKGENRKVAQNFKIYNFVNTNIFKFYLVFKMEF